MCDNRKYPEHYVVVPGLEKYYKHTLKNVKEVNACLKTGKSFGGYFEWKDEPATKKQYESFIKRNSVETSSDAIGMTDKNGNFVNYRPYYYECEVWCNQVTKDNRKIVNAYFKEMNKKYENLEFKIIDKMPMFKIKNLTKKAKAEYLAAAKEVNDNIVNITKIDKDYRDMLYQYSYGDY
jgi:hypothetical protein